MNKITHPELKALEKYMDYFIEAKAYNYNYFGGSAIIRIWRGTGYLLPSSFHKIESFKEYCAKINP